MLDSPARRAGQPLVLIKLVGKKKDNNIRAAHWEKVKIPNGTERGVWSKHPRIFALAFRSRFLLLFFFFFFENWISTFFFC